ncbi:MAG: S-adenosyl-l-methionine hydroxide adenosyltransferase family protein, partial [Candidatus Dormibacteria bacterium]
MSDYRCRTISFLSDYGLVDEFVGVCHGVMLRIAPEVTVIDVCHGIPPQNIGEGAAVLAQAVPYLPPGVHLAIVDPGVGGARLPVAVQAADGSWLVGPDNGLLVPAAARLGGATSVRKIQNPALRAPNPSRTFHGRDIFAPAAAHLARGVPPEELGDELAVENLVSLRVAVPRLHDGHFHAAVTHVDRFGNLSINVDAVAAAEAGMTVGTMLDLGIEGHRLAIPFGEAFASVPPAEPVVT